MKLAIGTAAAIVAVFAAGCDKKDQDAALDQGRVAVSKAADSVQGALNVKKLRSEMDKRVEIAMKLKENAAKSYEDVKAKLEHADAEYQDLKKKLADAQATIDSTSEKIKGH